MEKFFEKVIDVIKLQPRYLAPIALVLGFLIFAPTEWLAVLRISPIQEPYATATGVGFLFVVLLLGSHGIVALLNHNKSKSKGVPLTSSDRAKPASDGSTPVSEAAPDDGRLADLTEEEKEILRGYIIPDTRTQYFKVGDGVVAGLVHEDIIYQSSTIVQFEDDFEWTLPYNIQPWARKHLKEHPELLATKARRDSSATGD